MLDERFKARMSRLLGDSYPLFVSALEGEEAVRGVRVNTLKCSVSDFAEKSRISLSEIPYSSDSFILEKHDGIGNTPEHHSGMIYVQDPGAAASLAAIDIREGWRVLDMCAAPGGKSGQAAARIGSSGFLFSNEYVPKRAKIVVSNFERLGIKNAMVASLDTRELPKLFCEVFDLVIADVPCSGEGMFRKSAEALSEWSEENVLSCAERQTEILENAPPLIKNGGYLLYSTCTYSLEENEMVVDRFLSRHPEFKLIPIREELQRATADGIVFDGAHNSTLSLARRFYPHLSRGEGQFIALMQKSGGSENGSVLYKDNSHELSRDEKCAVDKFFKENLVNKPDGRVVKVGENLVILSHGFPVPPKSVFSAGVLLGSFEKGFLKPSHQFFSAYGELFIRREQLSHDDERTHKYLCGEEIEARDIQGSGWCVVMYEGVALGGGKVSSNRIKNHYPKGLRIK